MRFVWAVRLQVTSALTAILPRTLAACSPRRGRGKDGTVLGAETRARDASAAPPGGLRVSATPRRKHAERRFCGARMPLPSDAAAVPAADPNRSLFLSTADAPPCHRRGATGTRASLFVRARMPAIAAPSSRARPPTPFPPSHPIPQPVRPVVVAVRARSDRVGARPPFRVARICDSSCFLLTDPFSFPSTARPSSRRRGS